MTWPRCRPLPSAGRLDYWTFVLGPKFSAKERSALNLSRFYAIAQIEYCRNFIFKRNFPIHKLFERSCELGLWRLTADKIATIFGKRRNRRMRGKLATVIDRIDMAILFLPRLLQERGAAAVRTVQPSCATNCAPTISTTSVCAKD